MASSSVPENNSSSEAELLVNYDENDDNTISKEIPQTEQPEIQRLPNLVQDQKRIQIYPLLTMFAMIVFLPTGALALRQSIKVWRARKMNDDVTAAEASSAVIQFVLLSYFLGFLIAAAIVITYFIFLYQT